MTAIRTIVREFKKVFEGNKCRFRKGCDLYQEGEGKAYCGRYRSMQENEEKE